MLGWPLQTMTVHFQMAAPTHPHMPLGGSESTEHKRIGRMNRCKGKELKVEALSTCLGVTLTVLNAKVRRCLSVWQQF